MAGTFTSSIVAVESAKDTVISADGAFVDKNTGVPVSTENPHFTTMAAGQVQGLLSGEVNVALRGQKGALLRQFGALCATAGPIKLAQAAVLTLGPHTRYLESAAAYESLYASGPSVWHGCKPHSSRERPWIIAVCLAYSGRQRHRNRR